MSRLGLLLLIFIVTSWVVSCKNACDNFKSGTFSLYENDQYVGTIYRMDSIQLEEYDEDYEFANLTWTNDCNILMVGPRVEKHVDTITWLFEYEKVNDSVYKIQGIPAYVDMNYRYRAIMIKTGEQIPEENLRLIKKLNQKYN